jgi:preprotein translocase subunit SecF
MSAKKMFEIIPDGTKINFVKLFKFSVPFSLVLVVASIFTIVTMMDYGVDFRGGAEVQLKFTENIQAKNLRSSLSQAGFPNAIVQDFGAPEDHEFLVKLQGEEDQLNQITEDVESSLSKAFAGSGMQIRKVDIVGPKAGAQLRISGFQAMLWALIAIMIYVGLRFDFKYSPGAVVAVIHDVIIVLGVFSITHLEFTLQTVAAMLAVIGYSVNDTVVVYDRVREHEQRNPALTLTQHINTAINETLSRTLLTSGTTLFISVTMYFFGGMAIRDFFMAISLGVLIGTYSTIFIAAPTVLFFNRFDKGQQPKKAPPETTGAQV